MILIGRLALVLSLGLSLLAVALLAAGLRSRRDELVRRGHAAAYGLSLTALVASAVLLVAFLDADFSVAYVVEHSAPGLAMFYRLAGFWAGQQGSFLLWLFLLAAVTAVIAVRGARRVDRLDAGAVLVLCAVCAVFAALMVIDNGSDPFLAAPAGVAPVGLNPLLLHPAMVLHPPALFLGYVGLAVPFAYAVSAAAQRRGDEAWVLASQRWAVAGWTFLSLGIGLGAWWAYVILSWGGYWGWDPVENTSLIPWLTATALLHSFTLYRRRGIFKRWAVSLAMATFWLTIVATWTTRTGLINSVHAFEHNKVLIIVLSSLLVAVLAGGSVLLGRSWQAFSAEGELESLLSRDFFYYAANVALSLFAGAVLFATVVVPLVLGQTVRPRTYEALAQPLGVLTVLAVGVCPQLKWRRTSVARLPVLLAAPAAVATAALALLAAGRWTSSVRGLVGLAVCVFTAVSALQGLVVAARRGGASAAAGARRILSSRSSLAGVIAHLGMALAVAGLIGSGVYKSEQRVTLPATQGATASVHGYELEFRGLRGGSGPQAAERLYALIAVSRGGAPLGVLRPHLDHFEATGQTTARAVILGSAGRDLFISPEAIGEDEVTLQVDVFPLVRLMWAGAALLVVGGAVSLWPVRRPAAARAYKRVPEKGPA